MTLARFSVAIQLIVGKSVTCNRIFLRKYARWSKKGGFSERVQTVCYRHTRLQACITSHGVPRGHEEAGESKQTHPQGVNHSSIRKTPRHVPDMGAHIRQGLSNMLYVLTTPEEVTCSPLSGTTWLPNGPPCPTRPFGAIGHWQRNVSYV